MTSSVHNESSLPRKYNIKRIIIHVLLGIVMPIVLAIIMNQAIAAESQAAATTKPPAIYDILISDEADTDGYVVHGKSSLPAKTIKVYITVQITDAVPGIKVSALVNGVSNGMATEPAVNVTSKTGNIMKAFSFSNGDKPWPKGEYKVEVTLSSGGSKTSSFVIS